MLLKFLCHGIYIELQLKNIMEHQYTMKVQRYHVQKHGSTLKLSVDISIAAVV